MKNVRTLLEKTAEIKVVHHVSLADAWIGACAILQSAQSVPKDAELERLDCDHDDERFLSKWCTSRSANPMAPRMANSCATRRKMWSIRSPAAALI